MRAAFMDGFTSRIRVRMPRRVPAPRQTPPPQTRLRSGDLARLAQLSGGPLLILKGDCLVRHGHPFYDLYAVCSGHIQAQVTNAVNYVRVLGQYGPGGIIGLDARQRGNYPADFLALESSTVCAIPLAYVDEYLSPVLRPH